VVYLTLCTFSFEFKENSLSDTRCCNSTLWWQKNGVTLPEIFSAKLICHDVISLKCGGKQVNVSNVNKAKEWMATNNVASCTQCSFPPEYCTNLLILFRPLLISLTFVIIEMLDKLITCIVCWYNTLYHVLPVVWTKRITTRR
jgi:hypothetical protein